MGYLLSFFSLPMILDVLLIIHVVKTNRDRSWMYIILFIPIAGALAYFFVEILPDLLRRRTRPGLRMSAFKSFTSGGRLARLERDLRFSPTFANRRAVADELAAQGRCAEACEHYEQVLSGFDSGNVEVNLALAQCHFELGNNERAIEILVKLKDAPSLFKKYVSDLLLARVYERMGKTAEADRAYADIAPRFPGLEARARYGLFLRAQGRSEEAAKEFLAIEEQFEVLPGHNRRSEREWISLARRELKILNAGA
ncbi:MAG: tetratricopeptide repeat protein [Spirochaetales bacterium]|nr:tetratricopeptide repeat protein [Spirochaetales bacterium]